jgi:phage/plasmid-like protein (TIGR03299 family)
MSHDIWNEQMIYAGEVPWHGLGKQIGDNLSADAVIEALDLSEVEKRRLVTYDRNGNPLAVDSKFAVVRTKDDVVVGVVGEEFQNLQDADIIRTLGELQEAELCRFETAGLLKGGSRFFVMMNVPNGVLKLKTPNGKTDVVCQYLAVSHGHDGSLAFEFSPTNIRVVCANTVGMARAEAKEQGVSFRIKHTTNAQHRVEQAVAAYRASMEYHAAFAEKAQMLIETPFSFKQMEALATAIYPTPEGKESNIPGAVLKNRYEVQRLFIEGKGHQELGIVGTAWGAYNGVTEYIDWNRQTRGDKDWTEDAKRAKKWEASQYNPAIIEQKLFALSKIEELVAA